MTKKQLRKLFVLRNEFYESIKAITCAHLNEINHRNKFIEFISIELPIVINRNLALNHVLCIEIGNC